MRTFPKLSLSALLLCSMASLANPPVSDKLQHNLQIMRDVMQKALTQQQSTALSRVELSYLAGHGVLFRTSLQTGQHWIFDSADGNHLLPPLPPLPPLEVTAIQQELHTAAQSAISDDELDPAELTALAQQAGQATEQLVAQWQEQQEAWHEQQQELRQQNRQLARELREVQREKRDLEFSRQVGDQTGDLAKKLSELTNKEQQLQRQLSSAEQQYSDAQAQWQQKRQAQQQQAQQQQNELISKLGYRFASTLCDYGGSLRELKAQEFVGLQLDTRNRQQSGDVYWLYSKSDINQCISGNINAESLLKKARHYRH